MIRKLQLQSIWHLAPVVIILIGTVFTYFTWKFTQDRAKLVSQQQFDQISQATITNIEKQLEAQITIVSAVAVLLAEVQSIDQESFSRIVRGIQGDEPGFQAVEWIPEVAHADLSAFEKNFRSGGLPAFTVSQRSQQGEIIPVTKRAFYYPVVLIEPMAGNETVIGFDLASEDTRRTALESARDSGQLISSAGIDLVQLAQNRKGVLLFVPVYRQGVESLRESRHENLKGFVLGVLNIRQSLFSSGGLKSQPGTGQTLHLSLFDLTADEDQTYLYSELPGGAPGITSGDTGNVNRMELLDLPHYSRELSVGGRQWLITVHPEGGHLEIGFIMIGWLVIFSGVLVTFTLGYYVHHLSTMGRFHQSDAFAKANLLKDHESRYTAIIATALDGVITISDKGIIETFNPAAEEIFGYDSAEIIDRSIEDLFGAPYDRYGGRFMVDHLLAGRLDLIGHVTELVGRRRDGSDFPMELAASEVKTRDRVIFTGVVRDITSKKRVDRLKNEFISTVSHELRTPLTSIYGAIEIMRSNMLSDPEQIESTLDLAARNTQRLVSLVNELLDIEKLESDKAEFKFEHIDLEKTVDRSLMLNQTYADRYGVSLTLHSSVTDAVINADHDRLLQVMANLISNAVKFSPPGEPVLIRINEEKNGYKVSISDQGPGIPEEFRKNVFNRFSQADSSDTRKVQGSGLGLAICKAIVKRHKGHIDFDVIPDGGTVFYFTLPKIGRRRALL